MTPVKTITSPNQRCFSLIQLLNADITQQGETRHIQLQHVAAADDHGDLLCTYAGSSGVSGDHLAIRHCARLLTGLGGNTSVQNARGALGALNRLSDKLLRDLSSGDIFGSLWNGQHCVYFLFLYLPLLWTVIAWGEPSPFSFVVAKDLCGDLSLTSDFIDFVVNIELGEDHDAGVVVQGVGS